MDTEEVLYAVRTNSTTDPDDYWRARKGGAFLFCTGAGITPTWARTLTGSAVVAVDGGPA